VAPLFWFFLTRSFSQKNNGSAFFSPFIGCPEGPETSKTWKREFSGSQNLNASNRDFVRKSHK
jgi:hypothetical protein